MRPKVGLCPLTFRHLFIIIFCCTVRIANLVKVPMLAAIQDPTRVEARVRREVAMRKHGHEKMNAERKLTDEQRREKVEMKKVEEEKKGVYGVIFK
jgi:U4/U6 small nuclear ribonucleoprotein PRP3